MQTCKQCETEKSLDEFYVSNKSCCKDCTKTNVTARRNANIDAVRKYDRDRGRLAHRKEKCREYNRANPEKVGAIKKAWIARNQLKRQAHKDVQNAVRRGKLDQRSCEVCGVKRAEAHHDDYSKPLEVRWLCRKHHAEHHRRYPEEGT